MNDVPGGRNTLAGTSCAAGIVINPGGRLFEIAPQFIADKFQRLLDFGWCTLRMRCIAWLDSRELSYVCECSSNYVNCRRVRRVGNSARICKIGMQCAENSILHAHHTISVLKQMSTPQSFTVVQHIFLDAKSAISAS